MTIEAFEDRSWNTYMLTINMYDTQSRTGVFGALPSEYDNLAAEYRNYKGLLAATAFKDKAGDPWNYKVYIYDALGRVLFFDVKYGNLPWKRIKNEYDAANNMVKQSFYYNKSTSHNQNFYRWFDYDDEGRLSEVRSSMNDAKSTARLDKRYLYNNADQIDTSRFTGLTSPLWQKYGYDFRGRINSQAGTGKMEMGLKYHHNSNISETYFSYDGTTGLPQNEIEYVYDGLNRLTLATEKREQAFSEEYSYDPDGNILTKIRSNPGNGTFKEMYYNYESGTNRLDWLAIADDNMGYYEANYSTDSRGNITTDEYRSSSNFIYDHRNLPLQFSANGTTVKYSYDDNGNRIYKESGLTKEFYLRDHTGQELAVSKVSGNADTLMFYNIYGLGLEGRAEQTYTWNYETEPPQIERSDEPYYYIKDHLGTIRVTLNKQGTVVFAADYWPYGEKMAEYNSGSGTVQRYIFTEKERDTETGYDYFGARYYDSDLGRWLSVDPLMDTYPGWSPYNYVMNNPLRLVDPDGREIRIYTDEKDKEGNNLYITYAAGMQYEGDNPFVAAVISALNNMNSVEIGSIVLNSLIRSSNNFNFKKLSSGKSGTLQFKQNASGGGDILAADILGGSGSTNLNSVAHELFHGYQHENVGLYGANSEVESFLFAKGVVSTFYSIIWNFSGNDTESGQLYAFSMNSLLFSESFDKMLFDQAVNAFPTGNPFNGIYKKSKIYKNFNPIISRFFPLLRDR
ncbi:MAG: hypothetical protein HRU80_08215 [Ignavibacteriales bacterium]|nr:MAG: hypothetical protein HRU80_08215 [Ignavibacteriales bacterium]